jgi:dUTP pyrophosphatase
MLKVKKLHPDAKKPTRAHHNDLGMDIYSIDDYTISPNQQIDCMTGIACSLPDGYGAFIWEKSSVGGKGIKVCGGVVEGSYRKEWIVMLRNLSSLPYYIKKGQKIAQVIIAPVVLGDSEWVDELEDSVRGEGGFGSTGAF